MLSSFVSSGNQKRRHPAADDRGYLLVETLIAIAIFSIGFLALGTLILSTTRNNTTGNIATQAALLAAQTLEQLKSTSDLTTIGNRDEHGPLDHRGGPGGIFWRSWTVSDPVGFVTSRQITVRVRWDRLGQNRTVEMSTITKGNGT
jgi:type II secretory pathway pseudopilin PulG